jgi:hypothetical protein
MSIAINLKMRHPSQLCPVLAFGGMSGPVFGVPECADSG